MEEEQEGRLQGDRAEERMYAVHQGRDIERICHGEWAGRMKRAIASHTSQHGHQHAPCSQRAIRSLHPFLMRRSRSSEDPNRI
eukprot:6193560-Pleurochrysis_carterae.AAC.1